MRTSGTRSFAARSFRDVADLTSSSGLADTGGPRPGVPADPTALGRGRSPRTVPPVAGCSASLPRRLCAPSTGKTPYIRFDRNWYSIPYPLFQRPLTLIRSETVRLSTRPRVAETRCYEAILPSRPGTPPDLLPPAQAGGLTRRERLDRQSRRRRAPRAPGGSRRALGPTSVDWAAVDDYGAAELAAVWRSRGPGCAGGGRIAHLLEAARQRAASGRRCRWSCPPIPRPGLGRVLACPGDLR